MPLVPDIEQIIVRRFQEPVRIRQLHAQQVINHALKSLLIPSAVYSNCTNERLHHIFPAAVCRHFAAPIKDNYYITYYLLWHFALWFESVVPALLFAALLVPLLAKVFPAFPTFPP